MVFALSPYRGAKAVLSLGSSLIGEVDLVLVL